LSPIFTPIKILFRAILGALLHQATAAVAVRQPASAFVAASQSDAAKVVTATSTVKPKPATAAAAVTPKTKAAAVPLLGASTSTPRSKALDLWQVKDAVLVNFKGHFYPAVVVRACVG
jgi:hypothetical protein